MKIKDGEYEHKYIIGYGDTLEEAWSDWHNNLPDLTHKLTWWRMPPQVNNEVDFETKQKKWRISSRFSIIEIEHEPPSTQPMLGRMA